MALTDKYGQKRYVRSISIGGKKVSLEVWAINDEEADKCFEQLRIIYNRSPKAEPSTNGTH